jgi:hypothetical protein
VSLIFFVGLHIPAHAGKFKYVCMSINRLFGRRKKINPKTLVLVDSGAFTVLDRFGKYPDTHSVENYARELHRLHSDGVINIFAAVAQDYMCEKRITDKTGMTVLQHQQLTVQRYDDLLSALRVRFDGEAPFSLVPVIQGLSVQDYIRHIEMYGDRIGVGAYVGVGSICKRQGSPRVIREILRAIKERLPTAFLHGFGVKTTSLAHQDIRELLATADSMAWSYAARIDGRGPDANKWQEAKKFSRRIRRQI